MVGDVAGTRAAGAKATGGWRDVAGWPAWTWIGIGLLLRFLWPTEFLFRLDEAEHFEYSLRLSRDGEWMRHAWPSSVGIPNGPVFVWFLAAVTRFTLSPVAGTLAIAATNVIALMFAAPLLRGLLADRRDANLALALLATNPVAIWFSRKLWDPCLLPVLTVPALWFALRTLRDERSRAIAILLPLLALAAQVHQSAIFLAFVILTTVATRVRRLSPGWTLVGVGLAGAALAPYVSFLLEEVVGNPGAFTPTSGSRWPDIDVPTNLLIDISGHNILQSAGREGGWLLLWPFPPFGLLVQLAAIPLLVYALAGMVETWKPRRVLPPEARRMLLGVGLGLPLLYLVLRVRGVAHYFLGALPLLMVFVPIGVHRARLFPARARRFLWPLPVLVGVNVLSWLCFQSYISAHWGSDGYGLPYGKIEQACEEVAERAAELGRGGPEAPLILVVDVPRDRGVVPKQYEYVLRHRLGLEVRPPVEGEAPDLTLRIRWEKPGRLSGPPWTIMAGP